MLATGGCIGHHGATSFAGSSLIPPLKAKSLPENDDHIFSDDAVEDETAGAARPFNRPLLKVSLLGVIISGVVVLISAILANVATANSDLEFAASVVNRLATVLMLIAFGGIFMAYQIPKLQKLGHSFHPGMPPAVIPTISHTECRDVKFRID